MGIPSLQERVPMLDNRRAQARQIPRAKTPRAREFDRVEPVFRGRVTTFNVDVWRLTILQTVEEEPESAGS
jgi:hypothetical protein